MFNKKDIFKKIKAKVHDRKGLGMELAMMVLLVVFGCSLTMISSAMWARNHLTAKEEQTMQRLEIDEYAELVLSKGSGGLTEEEKARFPDYSNNWDGETVEITYGSETVLEITLENNTIKSWTYTKTGE